MPNLTRFCALAVTFVLALAVAVDVTAASAMLKARATSDDAFQLTPASRSSLRPLIVDRTGLLSISIVAASRTLVVVLTAPGGARFTIGDAPSSSFQSSVTLLGSGTTQGAGYFATFANPTPGAWTLSVTESGSLTAPLDVVVTENFSNTTAIVVAGSGESIPIGSNTRVALVVFDGTQKLKTATVLGRLVNPNDSSFVPLSVTFRDDGTGADEIAADGIYEAFVTTAKEGIYFIRVEATGTASTGAFRRTSAAELRFVKRIAQIAGFNDFGSDDDFDGYYDRVVVMLKAMVAESGTYTVSASLTATNGKEVTHSVQKAFTVGNAPADIEFSAKEIRDLGVDGPYSVAEVRYAKLVNGDPVPADIRYDLGSTNDYLLSDFQHLTLRVEEGGTAIGIDLDGDHLFDALEIKIGLSADFSGQYDASVSLTDSNGREIAFASGSIFLDTGLNSIRIVFDGRRIGENGVNGPYILSNLIVFGEEQSLIVTRAFTTPFFYASQFEGYVPVPRRRTVRH